VKKEKITNNTMDKQTLLRLAQAFIYQLCDEESANNEDCHYFYDKPIALEHVRGSCSAPSREGTSVPYVHSSRRLLVVLV